MRTIIGIQLLGLILFSFFQKGEVEIAHDPPVTMKPKGEKVVTVTIDKSDVQGFAKYQITLDEGLIAEEVESAGASFTYNDGKAKFIWMALPKNAKFNLKYRIVSTGAAAMGKKSIESRFSYIYDNERKNYDLPTHFISVGDDPSIAQEAVENIDEPTPQNENAAVVASRSLKPEGVNQWRVNVKIEKQGLGGFAKVEENIPEGYTAVDLKSSGAVFSSEGEVVKYIWYDIPENESITVTYKLLPVIALTGEEPSINGAFSFLQEEETVEIPIVTGEAELSAWAEKDTAGAEIIEEPPAQESEVIDESDSMQDEVAPAEVEMAAQVAETSEPEKPEEEDSSTTTDSEKGIADATQPGEKSKVDANIIDVPEPEEGIFYRVQIAAGKNNLQRNVFEGLYAFNEGFNIETHRGWFKYTTGYHQVYKSARDDRERITEKYDKFQGPFVTAYNSGERISVQEALMITDQRWYP